MAATSSRSIGIAKRLVNRASVPDPIKLAPPVGCFAGSRRTLGYEKNPDDQGRPAFVRDEGVIEPQPDWAPDPKTGVFGPADENSTGGGGPRKQQLGFQSSATQGSVLEEQAWFRPTSIEDPERPHPQ